MNCKFKASLLLLALPATLTTRPENETGGTLVVIGWSQSKIVVAADSRRMQDGTNSFDDACKILTLDDHSIFTASGFVVHATPRRVFWDAFNEAGAAFRQARKAHDSLRVAATDWGNRMISAVNESLKTDMPGTMKNLEENRFFTGIFIGFENGSAAMYQVEVIFDPSTRKAAQVFDEERGWPTLHFGALGKNQIVNEVLIGKSDFAKAEQQKWEALKRDIPPMDRDVFWAIRLVEISIAYHPTKIELGGPIDALEITSKGIRWIRRKPTCMKNNPATHN